MLTLHSNVTCLDQLEFVVWYGIYVCIYVCVYVCVSTCVLIQYIEKQ
jgi:hypothetical protein